MTTSNLDTRFIEAKRRLTLNNLQKHANGIVTLRNAGAPYLDDILRMYLSNDPDYFRRGMPMNQYFQSVALNLGLKFDEFGLQRPTSEIISLEPTKDKLQNHLFLYQIIKDFSFKDIDPEEKLPNLCSLFDELDMDVWKLLAEDNEEGLSVALDRLPPVFKAESYSKEDFVALFDPDFDDTLVYSFREFSSKFSRKRSLDFMVMYESMSIRDLTIGDETSCCVSLKDEKSEYIPGYISDLSVHMFGLYFKTPNGKWRRSGMALGFSVMDEGEPKMIINSVELSNNFNPYNRNQFNKMISHTFEYICRVSRELGYKGTYIVASKQENVPTRVEFFKSGAQAFSRNFQPLSPIEHFNDFSFDGPEYTLDIVPRFYDVEDFQSTNK